MRHTYRTILLLILFIMGFFVASADSIERNEHTIADLISFVDEAAAFAEENGREVAFEVFNDLNGSFHQDDLYIYVYDMNGTVLAHPVNPELIGVNRYMEKDAIGTYFIQNLMDAAINETGFTRYTYINPVNNNQIEEKLGYVRMVNGEYWLGSGLYGGKVEKNFPSQLSSLIGNISELIRFTEGASDFVIQDGKETALSEFSKYDGEFVSGDQYISAYNLSGTNLAHPYHPEFIGKNRLLVTDQEGKPYVKKMTEIASSRGKGFLVYQWEEPVTGEIKPKLAYLIRIDDWFILSGIFL